MRCAIAVSGRAALAAAPHLRREVVIALVLAAALVAGTLYRLPSAGTLLDLHDQIRAQGRAEQPGPGMGGEMAGGRGTGRSVSGDH